MSTTPEILLPEAQPEVQRSYPDLPMLDPLSLKPALDFTLVKDGASLEKLRSFLAEGHTDIGLDYETNIVDNVFQRRARTLQIGNRERQFIVDWMEWTGGREQLYMSQGHYGSRSFYGAVNPDFRKMIDPVVEVVKPVLQSGAVKKLGQNLEFEYLVSKWCFGIRMWNLYCTQMGEKLIYAGLVDFFESGFWGMEDIVARRLKVEISKKYQKIDWMEERPLTEDELTYCALDVRLPFAIRAAQEPDLRKGRLFRVAQIENDAIPAFGDMKLNGFKLYEAAWRALIDANQEAIDSTIKELDELFIPIVGEKAASVPDPARIEELEKLWKDLNDPTPEEAALSAEIKTLRKKDDETQTRKAALVQQREVLQKERRLKRDEARGEYNIEVRRQKAWHKDSAKWKGSACINYGSGSQLLKVFHASNWFTKKEKERLTNTDDGTLDKFAAKPVIKLLRKYRKLDKRKTSYSEKWLRLENDPQGGFTDVLTGRLHSDIIQLGADTGRTSSREPNFQNLPKEDEYRACFVARDGYKLLTIDYNGCELRILAELSGEEAWIDAFNKNWDVHSVCAEFLYRPQWEAATVHEQYQVEKNGKIKVIPKCAYYHTTDNAIDEKTGAVVSTGHDHGKCECPGHKDLRNKLKAVNFGIAYGKTAYGLAADLEITQDEAEQLLRDFAKAFPTLWKYLEESGLQGLRLLEARTMADRRRAFESVSWEQAKKLATKRVAESMAKWGIEPTLPNGFPNPKFRTEPYHKEIVRAFKGIEAGITRQAKNTPIQGTNADIIKLAIGCGFDSNGVPFMWHRLETWFAALLENLVHDENVIEAPDREGVPVTPFYEGEGIKEGNAQAAFDWASDCMTRAGAEFVKRIPMISEGHIDVRWRK